MVKTYCADKLCMSNKFDVHNMAFEIPPVVLFERRVQPDRRKVWRGGRRDSDWLSRPMGSLDKLDRLRKKGIWHRWFFISSVFNYRSKFGDDQTTT